MLTSTMKFTKRIGVLIKVLRVILLVRDVFIDCENFKLTVGTAKASVNLNIVSRSEVCCPTNVINTIFDGGLHIPELQ